MRERRKGQMRSIDVRRATGALVVAAAVGCGGVEEKPQPSGAPMAAAVAPAATAGENHAPVIERVRLEPEEPIPGGHVRALVQASDADGGSLRLHHAWTLAGAPVGTDSPELAIERGRKGDDLAVTVIASDESAQSAPVRARTVLGNQGPRLTSVVLEPAEGLEVGGRVKALPEAVDPDADTLRYEVAWLVNGSAVGGSGLDLETKGLRRGDRIRAEVRASDGKVTTEPVASQELQIGNSAPQIVSRPGTQFEDGVFRYVVEARDLDGDHNLRFSLLRAPEGMSIDRFDGSIRWAPGSGQTGIHVVEVAVEDGQGGKTAQSFELRIGSEPAAGGAAPPAARAEP